MDPAGRRSRCGSRLPRRRRGWSSHPARELVGARVEAMRCAYGRRAAAQTPRPPANARRARPPRRTRGRACRVARRGRLRARRLDEGREGLAHVAEVERPLVEEARHLDVAERSEPVELRRADSTVYWPRSRARATRRWKDASRSRDPARESLAENGGRALLRHHRQYYAGISKKVRRQLCELAPLALREHHVPAILLPLEAVSRDARAVRRVIHVGVVDLVRIAGEDDLRHLPRRG